MAKRLHARQPFVPRAEAETVRQGLLRLLEEGSYTLRQLSGLLGMAEKSLVPHLEHLQRSLHHEGTSLKIDPAVCKKCGFIFAKRDRIARPGRCPVCKGESLTEPLFRVEPKADERSAVIRLALD